MQTFSWPVDKAPPVAVARCFASNLMRVEIYTFFTGATDVVAAPILSQSSVYQNRNLNMIGAALCERLLDASS